MQQQKTLLMNILSFTKTKTIRSEIPQKYRFWSHRKVFLLSIKNSPFLGQYECLMIIYYELFLWKYENVVQYICLVLI